MSDKSFTLHFSDGSNSRYGISEDAAYSRIAAKYGVAVSDLVTDDSGDRTLVWLSEADAENDAGAKAVAELRRA